MSSVWPIGNLVVLPLFGPVCCAQPLSLDLTMAEPELPTVEFVTKDQEAAYALAVAAVSKMSPLMAKRQKNLMTVGCEKLCLACWTGPTETWLDARCAQQHMKFFFAVSHSLLNLEPVSWIRMMADHLLMTYDF